MSKYSYAGIAIMSLILDVLIHINSISKNIDPGTVATVGQIAIAAAASSLALAGITGQQNAQSGKLDTIVHQTDGAMHETVQSAIDAAVRNAVPPVIKEAVSTIIPVPVPVPTVVMGTPVPAGGLPPTVAPQREGSA